MQCIDCLRCVTERNCLSRSPQIQWYLHQNTKIFFLEQMHLKWFTAKWLPSLSNAFSWINIFVFWFKFHCEWWARSMMAYVIIRPQIWSHSIWVKKNHMNKMLADCGLTIWRQRSVSTLAQEWLVARRDQAITWTNVDKLPAIFFSFTLAQFHSESLSSYYV